MANYLMKLRSRGNSKIYYQVDEEFVAVGKLSTNWSMYYTAAHPQKGLWLCDQDLSYDKPIIIGFVRWDNISRVVIDIIHKNVFIVVKDYSEVVQNADSEFRILYKKTVSHQMSDTSEMSICLPFDLFSGRIIPYIERTVKTKYKAEEVKSSLFLTISSILVIILMVLGVVCGLIDIFGDKI